MITWKLYQDYLSQDERFNQMRAKYDQAANEAGTTVKDLVAEYDVVLKREIQSGKDLSAEKEKLRKKIVEAEKVYDLAKEERDKAYQFINVEIGDAETDQKIKELESELERLRGYHVQALLHFNQAQHEREKYAIQADIDNTLAQIEQAQSELSELQEKKSKFKRITDQDIAIAWNQEYRPMVREKRLNPIIDRMAAAKEEYFNAVLDYYELRDEYHSFSQEISYLTRNTGQYINSIVELRDLPRISDDELHQISTRKALPVGIDRKSINLWMTYSGYESYQKTGGNK